MDFLLLDWIQTLRTPAGDFLMPILTTLGEAGMVWIAVGIGLLCFKKTRPWGFLLLLSMLVSFLTGELGIKNLVGRIRPCYQRPFVPLLIEPPSSFSFPSGHSASSFASAFILARMDKRAGIGAYVLASLIAFSRLYLYVHFPSDVLAGMLWGTLCAAVVYGIYRNRQKKQQALQPHQ